MSFKKQKLKFTFKKAIRKKDKTDTKLLAAMCLLTADQILWNKVKSNIRENSIDYAEVRLDTVTENCYILYSASKSRIDDMAKRRSIHRPSPHLSMEKDKQRLTVVCHQEHFR